MTAQPRALSVSDVLSAIKTFEPRKALETMVELRLGLSTLSHSYAAKPEKEKGYIAARFEKAIAQGNRHQKLLAASVLHEITGDYAPLARIARWLRHWDMGLTERYHSWFSFMAIPFDRVYRFTPFQRAKLDRHARQVYARLFADASDAWSSALPNTLSPQSERRRVALSVCQYLGHRHAPTAAVRRMAARLRARGFEVKIFNLNHTPTRIGSAFYATSVASSLAEFDGLDSMDVGNDKIAQFWQNPHYGLTPGSFSAFVTAVQDFAPDCWITLGPGNLYADLLTSQIPSTSMPMTSDLCIGMPGAYGSVRDLSPVTARLLSGVGITRAHCVDLPNGFALPETGTPIDRSSYGLNEHDFALAIVTNRPEQDLSQRYLRALDALCTRAANIRIRVFGSALGRTDWSTFPQLSQAMAYGGFSADLVATLSGFDAVLNPPRQGGGTSAAYAMALGIPVFTLDDCDVATLTGPDFIWPDHDALLEGVARAAASGITPAQKDKAKARWKVISDLDGQLDALIAGAKRRS